MNIYCGNISYDTNEDALKDLFAAYGAVSSVRVIKDRDTGRSKGFAFVDMDNDSEAKEAIEALNEKDYMGRALRINEARPREERR